MRECSKSIQRRLADSNFINCYFVGTGIDIGGKIDPLSLYQSLFCRLDHVRTWDLEDGDAEYMHGLSDESFDFVHSSHCLEHLINPQEGLKNWFRILRPGGYLIVTVPDEDLYEQGIFPSTFNKDHKWTFTIYKHNSWSNQSINIFDMIQELGADAEPVRIEQLFANYRFDLPRYDQTLSPIGECGIEFIVRKRLTQEILDGGRWRRTSIQPNRELRIHLNQHRDDLKILKQSNQQTPPFLNDSDI